jgi:hypothetical protein
MRRHSIIARLNPADTQIVNLKDLGSEVTSIHFVDGERRLGFGLGQILDQLAERGMYAPEEAIDLAILAATVTAADTRISRRTESQDSWTREIDLYLPVRDPALWDANARLITRTLAFLTGDRWRVFFRERQPGVEELIERPAELVGAPFDSVCLFSGGLDSFIGAIDLLDAGGNPLFVSHYWDVSTSSQKPCADALDSVYGDMQPRHVRSRVGFRDDLVRDSEPEKTTRGRSFLFFALAALAASSLEGRCPIYVPENGLISLNVPLDPLRLGAWSTRTTHPFYMARWQELLDRLNVGARLANPYRFKTKGEMMSNCANAGLLRQNVATTISCSSVTKARWKKQPLGHCGYCAPCLIRRSAIRSAFGNDPTTYSIADLAAEPLDASRAESEHVRSFQMMHRRLVRQPDVASILIHKTGPLSDYSDREIDEYTSVFSRGIAEVAALLEDVVVTRDA